MKRGAMKRALDFGVALVALVILSPALLAIAIAIWLEDFRFPFYAGARVGQGGAPFRMIKFRSMHAGASKTGVNSTALDDARITSVGKFLRRAKLDELPQLCNVLLGDMSLVGPRPQVPADAGLYTVEERRMLLARPGVTDLASIVFADEGEILAGSADPDLRYNQVIRPWKSRLALFYVDWCAGMDSCAGDSRRGWFAIDLAHVILDSRILILTATALFSRRRALSGIGRILEKNYADPLVIRMAARREPLIAYPPPGAHGVVERYASSDAPQIAHA
jgi:lipopolysaccharide/colanic/teichoic acid biosynthesis glycosyltransferase